MGETKAQETKDACSPAAITIPETIVAPDCPFGFELRTLDSSRVFVGSPVLLSASPDVGHVDQLSNIAEASRFQ